MKKLLLSTMLSLTAVAASADEIDVKSYSYAGPYIVHAPVLMDSVDVNSRAFAASALLNNNLDLSAVEGGKVLSSGETPGCESSRALHLMGFTVTNTSYISATISVGGLKYYQVFVDGKQVNGGYTTLLPSVHKVVIKYLSEPGTEENASIKVDADNVTVAAMDGVTTHPYSLADVMHARTCSSLSLSNNGRFLIYSTSEMQTGGSMSYKYYLKDLSTGQVLDRRSGLHWMPQSDRYYYTQKNDGAGYTLYVVDPVSRKETVLSRTLPVSSFVMSPTEDYIVYSEKTNGPKEKKEIFEILEPDDRQPGWRNRTNLYRYDLRSGLVQQLTYGYHNISIHDISNDGKYALISKSESRLTKRPTSVSSLYRLNMQTYALDTLVANDGFIGRAKFSPNGSLVLVTGSPEALDGIGVNVAEGQTPSQYDNQLFLSPVLKDGADYSPKNWKALTRDFNPSVQNTIWSLYDGMVYMTAEDKDYINLFRLNPNTGKITKLETGVELVQALTVSDKSNVIAYSGQGASYGDRIYTMNSKSLKGTMVEDVDGERLASISLGKCESWDYVNEEGDTVCCRYYLPYNFDASKHYPMIVDYYGGCSPTSRTFHSRYPQHAYASMGYVVLVVNPRGASGFGQKWSAAHVNTAGKGVADDIIGAVKTFCKEHDFVNSKKVGCVGASYGGFMTQYLQTVTDIFAAAVSHAGISDHTSYWGEGYWGYSYSEVSMANSYPWTRKDLFVDQSPLYNADKIHTPLLFVHGTGDTNVPVGESIQMYTALKLLDRPTAMVLVEGENHWILDYNKRIQWQNTIWAWFAKYLQDDDSWWESMYAKKSL